MLSALVHAGLVWREEVLFRRERRAQSAALEAAALESATHHEVVQSPNETSPLLARQMLLGYGSRGRSIGGGSRV